MARPGIRIAVTILITCLMVGATETAGNAAATDSNATSEPSSEPADEIAPPWSEIVGDEVVVDLYFVWSSTCPHCRAAHPFVEDLEATHPWLRVHWLQVDGDESSAVDTAVSLADSIGEVIRGVPTFMWCERLISGYDDEAGVGAFLESQLVACHERLVGTAGLDSGADASSTTDDGGETDDGTVVAVPIVGDVAASDVSLPTFTVLVAAVDAFNPCAFFVLLFLLSLLVHARSRWRMAIIGGTFVLCSGIIYFLFMAAWLNVFLVTENIRWITLVAGVIAVTIAVLNLKDAFGATQGPSLSIPERAKPGLYSRMRGLVAAERYPAMLAGTVALAVAVNSYELLCTAGLPMAFTRVLTLNDLSTPTYYLYLAVYNVVYVIPLLLIVGGFVVALGSRKLQSYEGRALKLLSGTMMLGLGAILLLAPDLLGDPWAAIGVVIGSIVITVIITIASRSRTHHPVAG